MPTVNEIPRLDTTRPPSLADYTTEALERMLRALRVLGSLHPGERESVSVIECELRRRPYDGS